MTARPAGDDEAALCVELPLLVGRGHDERFTVAESAFVECDRGVAFPDSSQILPRQRSILIRRHHVKM